MQKKRMTVANFNVVFGAKEEPLLNYFHSIIMPALTNNPTRAKGESEYQLLNVEVIDIGDSDFVLTGVIVKKTVLEVFSKMDEEGKLVQTNEFHPTAPYSIFSIYLSNHRMILIKNQKGSPDLRNFSSTIKYIISNYIREENNKRSEDGHEIFPHPIINVIGIPMKDSIKDALKRVSRINRLTLRFYPLNGDLDLSGIFEGMTTDLRKKVQSKTGSVVLNSPKSKAGVADVITAAQGTIEPIFEVTYPDNSKGKIKNGTLSENIEVSLDNGITLENAITSVTNNSKKLDSISMVSEGNQKIYEAKKSNIIPFVKKK